MEQTQDPKTGNVLKACIVIIGLVLGALVAPFIFSAIKGLIGLAIGGGLVLFIWYFSFVIGQKAKNWRIRMVQAEAAANPIAQLINEQHEQQKDAAQFEADNNALGASCADFKNLVRQYASDFPDQLGPDTEYADMMNNLKQMEELLKMRQKQYVEFCDGMAKFDREVKRAEAIWRIHKASARFGDHAGADTEIFLRRIAKETAITTVREAMSGISSKLNNALAKEQAQAARQRIANNGKAVQAQPVAA